MKSFLYKRLILGGYINEKELVNPLIIMLRIVAAPIVFMGSKAMISPNIITILSLLLGCSAGYYLYIGDTNIYFLLWCMSIILDYVDGAVARKTNKESHSGYLMDMLGDRVKLIVLLLFWAAQSETILAFILVSLVIILLIMIVVISHLFVKRDLVSDIKRKITLKSSIYNIFVMFDMHSFLLLGVSIYIGYLTGYIAVIWLCMILVMEFARQANNRIDYNKGNGEISLLLNDHWFKR